MASGFLTPGGTEISLLYLTSLNVINNLVGSEIWAWGSGGSGQLGQGTFTNSIIPNKTLGGSSWIYTDMAGSGEHTAGIKNDGTLWMWGSGSLGRLAQGADLASKSSPVQVSGTWKTVTCGGSHTLGIKTDGTLWSWGSNSRGQLGDGTTTDRSSPVTVSGGGTTWSQLSAGSSMSYGIKTDGTLWCWGYNAGGQLGDGTTVDKSSPITVSGGGNWKEIVAIQGFTGGALAIKTDGTLWSWGYNGNGILGNGNTVSRSSPGSIYPTTWDGGTVIWKKLGKKPLEHALAIDSTNRMWGWGWGLTGQLGNNLSATFYFPTRVNAGNYDNWFAWSNWQDVANGYRHSVGLKTDGTLWVWGAQTFSAGELGLGTSTTASYFSPIQNALPDNNWKSVCGGFTNTAAIRKAL